MEAYWEPKNSDECNSVQAEIIRCVHINNSINILFKGIDVDDDNSRDIFEGQVSFDTTKKGKQVVEGKWIYPDTIKESSRFSEQQQESENSIFIARVIGELSINDKKIRFIGEWDDEIWDKEDGCIYTFEIDAELE